MDAFLQDWSVEKGYAFPPFAIIMRVAAHIHRQSAELTLITPFWRSQVWFPVLLELSWDSPILLPQIPDLLKNPEGLRICCWNRGVFFSWLGGLQGTMEGPGPFASSSLTLV